MTPTLESAFTLLMPDAVVVAAYAARLREQMAIPLRFYHNEQHIRAVLECVYRWTNNSPSKVLTAAVLYHDAIYDATRRDNEEISADFCRAELATMGVEPSLAEKAARLILKTTDHEPDLANPDEVLLLDADLYILGSSPEEYAAYVLAVRTEYAHVSYTDWRVGRAKVLQHFLQRPRLYHGDWAGRDAHEAQARANLQAEHLSLIEA